jgi:hypothetical protein
MKLGGFQGGTCGTSAVGVAGACHASMTQLELDENSEWYETSLFALAALLQEKGHAWTPVSPYIAAADYTAAGTISIADAKQTLGAAFNLNMLLHEPGGYAHNRYYAKRLIFDSIDFVYNGVLETLVLGSGNATNYYEGSDVGAALQHAVGLSYTDHAGVAQIFTQAQADLALAYLDRRPDAAYPTYPGVQRP